MQKTIPHRTGEADFRIPVLFGKYYPPKIPYFLVFHAFAKVWCKMTSQPLQIGKRAIRHWKEHKKLNKEAPT